MGFFSREFFFFMLLLAVGSCEAFLGVRGLHFSLKPFLIAGQRLFTRSP